MNHRTHPLTRSFVAGASLALLCLVGLLPAHSLGQVTDAELPLIDAPVTDQSGVLTTEGMATLSAELVRHREATGVQLAVLLVDTTGGEPIEDYALRVATRWRGGSAARSEGALYVLAVADRRQRLEVGYGLEDRIPDYVAAGILEEAIPYLRRQSYQGAVEAVVRGVVTASSDMAPIAEDSPPEGGGFLWKVAAFLVYGVIALLGTFVGRSRRLKAAAARTQELALGLRSSAQQLAMVWMGLYVFAAGTAAGLLGFGWFHYLGAFLGLLAGWHFAWDSLFLTLHYIIMVSGMGGVFGGVVTGFSGDAPLGVLLGFVVQLVVTLMYAGGVSRNRTAFTSSGVKDETDDFYQLVRAPSVSSSTFGSLGASSHSSAHSHTASSSSFGSSKSSSFGSSGSSSSSSRSSSSSSSGYSGGGGRFGGGGASSSW